MKLIVIGASGLIGGEIYRLARERGMDVIGTTRTSGHGEFYYFDMTDVALEKSLDKILKVSGIHNGSVCAVIAAAFSNINQCYEQPVLAKLINITGTKKLLSYFYKKNIKTLFLSSDAVFDGLKGNYIETDRVHPLCVYGHHKAEIESYIQRHMPETLIYRLAKVVGDSPSQNHLFKEIYDKHRSNETIKCIQGLWVCPTYVKDIAACVLAGLNAALCGLYHVAGSDRVSRFDLTCRLLKALQSNIDVQCVPMEEFNFKEPKILNITLSSLKVRGVLSMEFTPIDRVIENFIGNCR